jgi:hypothetical protein
MITSAVVSMFSVGEAAMVRDLLASLADSLDSEVTLAGQLGARAFGDERSRYMGEQRAYRRAAMAVRVAANAFAERAAEKEKTS